MNFMVYKNLQTLFQKNTLIITINRERKLNALNVETLKELNVCLTRALANNHVNGVIITGAGKKAFVAGADINEFVDLNQEQAEELSRSGQVQVFDLIANFTKPIIAAINGFALGGGLELALACHIRVSTNEAVLGFPEVGLGLIPGYGGTQRLSQLVGKGKALEMILTGDQISAVAAYDIGLVNHVVLPEQLLGKAIEIMDKILSRSPMAVTSALKVVNASFLPFVLGYEEEIKEFGRCFSTMDFKEGVNAFIEKRKAHFVGR
jgi:enoyl-CoA hydratase